MPRGTKDPDDDPETLSELPGITASLPAQDRTDQAPVSEDFDATIPQPDRDSPEVEAEQALLRIALNRPVPLKEVSTSAELSRKRIAQEETHVGTAGASASVRPTEPPEREEEESKTDVTPVPTWPRR